MHRWMNLIDWALTFLNEIYTLRLVIVVPYALNVCWAIIDWCVVLASVLYVSFTWPNQQTGKATKME